MPSIHPQSSGAMDVDARRFTGVSCPEVKDSAAMEALSQDFRISWLECRDPLRAHCSEPVVVCVLRPRSEECTLPLPLAVMLVGDGHFWEPKAMNGDLDLLVGNPTLLPWL